MHEPLWCSRKGLFMNPTAISCFATPRGIPCPLKQAPGCAGQPPVSLPELLDDAKRQLVLPDASHLMWGLPHQLNGGDVAQVQPAGSLLFGRGTVRGCWMWRWGGGQQEGLLTCSMEICIL